MTIRHIVLFKLKSGIEPDDPRVLSAMAMSRSHGKHIDEIQEWWAGPDVSRRDISYDFAVEGVFADMDAVARYAVHAHHQQGVALWCELATWVVVDLDERFAAQETD